ncbi:lipoprotein signal peptidase [Alphaproteobacteria bacterium]|nr:lipoprotein signal peptidase [Alphaproteobacteria bacterium]
MDMRKCAWLAAAVFVADQASKAFAVAYFDGALGIKPLTGFFNFVLTYNRGISFSLLSGEGLASRLALTALAAAIVGGLVIWLRREDDPAARGGLALLIGGALGNIADRVARGAVVDFLDFYAWGWHWPAFNLADTAICLGAATVLLSGLRAKKPAK